VHLCYVDEAGTTGKNLEDPQHLVPPLEAGAESVMLPDVAAQMRCLDFCTPHDL
jgi:hypothetical protein